ncbi:MAG: hypothetical protein RQM90_13440 [Methanoculleus sp.]
MSQETKEPSAPAGQIEVAEVERLVRERTREIQSENEALRRENAEFLRAKGMLGTFEAQMGEAMYRALLDSIDEGFCIIEVIFDAGGEPVDYRFLETNRAFAKQTGMHNALGKRMRGSCRTMKSTGSRSMGPLQRPVSPGASPRRLNC